MPPCDTDSHFILAYRLEAVIGSHGAQLLLNLAGVDRGGVVHDKLSEQAEGPGAGASVREQSIKHSTTHDGTPSLQTIPRGAVVAMQW